MDRQAAQRRVASAPYPWRQQLRLMQWRLWMLVGGLGLCVGLSTVIPLINRFGVLESILPTLAVWLAAGLIQDDPALELVQATGVSVRWLWLARLALILGPLLLLVGGWLVLADMPLPIAAYGLTALLAVVGIAQGLELLLRQSLAASVIMSSMLLTQLTMPLLWLPDGPETWLARIKRLLFLPIDTDPMYTVFLPDRGWTLLVVGALGLLGWLWSWQCYRRLELRSDAG